MFARFATQLTDALSLADYAALSLYAVAILAITYVIERKSAARPSTARLMAERRAIWMTEMANRDVRIMDTQLLAIQHRGAAFFASACMIGVGGVVALIGATDQLLAVARDLTAHGVERQRAVWELKLLFLLFIIVLALLKFIWAHRLFGYCAILIGATPPLDAHQRTRSATEAAAINVNAGRSFNRGLRLIYFSLAALAWMLGPLAFTLATLLTVLMLVRREYYSETRRILDRDAELGADDALR
ncbi:MAG: DUF599 domain-containing protein [Neomegalonema sp.]|nr:DUF599 domain-containing protein [Neomegalonema sp.]